uniref:RNA-directed DNA polymerase n=1 Tax=Strongyloides papillosus TaxID=174720 RepID=A0A0N5BCJ0_STREA
MLLDYDGDKLKFKGKRPTVPKLFHPKSFETFSQFKIGNAIAFLDLEAVSEGHQTSVLLSFLDPEIVKHLSVVFGEDKLLKTEYSDVEEYLSSTYVNRESTLGKAFKLLSFDRGDDTFPLWHAKIVGQVKSFKSAFDQEVSVLVVLKMIMHEYSDEIQREIYKYIETKPQVLLQDLFSYIDTFMKVSTTGAINEVRAVYKKKYKKKKNKVKFRGDFSRRKVDELSCRDDVTSIVNVGSLSLNKDNSFYSIYINNVCVVFKVDTGADISVINPETFSKLRNVKLIKSNLTGRACNGNAKTKIFVGQVVRNLLGGDAAWSAIREVMLNSVDALGDDLELRNIILAKYPMLVSENLSKGISTFVADVSLKKDIQPIYIPARKVPVGYESLVRDLLQEWVRDGIIEKYHGVPRWASPIMLARENGRKPRLCVDFSASVNKCVEPLSYGIPDLPSLLNDLYQAEWYTHLDLKSAFLQVPISKRLQDIMVLSTQHGHYQFKKLPFGYINAPLIMQKIMEICLSDAMEDGKSFVKIYFDDVLIYGKSRDEIIRRTNVVCSLLEKHGFTLNMSKSRFAVQEILFLGWSIAKGVRKPHDDRIESIVSLREPQSVSEVRQILGLISHYSSCIPKLHKYLHVFSDLCQKNSKFYWDEVLSSHFNEIKSLIATQTKTYLFNPTWTSVLSTDASSKAIGGVLEQICPSTGIHYPVWHFCKKLTKCQVNWSMTEKEAYSLIVGLRKFSYFLLGRKFLVNVDHSALLFLFGSHKGISAVTSGRIQRWLWEAQRFQFDISFIGTKEFSKADILTRLYNEESTLESEMIVAEIVSEEPEIFSLCPQLIKDEI